jgi:hypothetical protein
MVLAAGWAAISTLFIPEGRNQTAPIVSGALATFWPYGKWSSPEELEMRQIRSN